MFNFLSLKPESFGLDFSDHSLRIIRLCESGMKFNVASFNEIDLPDGTIRNGEIKNEEALVTLIKQAVSSVKGRGLGTKYVIASLPERKAFLRIIHMPCLPEEDLKAAVVFEAENYIPLPSNDVYLDSQVIPFLKTKNKIQDHYDVLISALPKKTVDPYLSVLKKAGLVPTVLEIESFSMIRALVKDEVEKAPIAVIDLGEARTAFITFSGVSLRDSFTIPVSARDFSSAIVKNLNVDLKRAEELKAKHGLDNKSEEGKEVFDALTPVLADLIEQLKKYIDYYQSHNDDSSENNKIEKILLTGENATLKNLPEIFSEQLSVKVEVGNPWINAISPGEKVANNFPIQKSLLFTSAIGLALRGVKRDN
ncbi:MAG: type IV pilus assembly protein PilM [Candidatus Nealsonbacteria bacterium]